MADARDLKSLSRKGVWVRLPPQAPVFVRGSAENEDCRGVAASVREPAKPGSSSIASNFASAGQSSFEAPLRTKTAAA